MSTSTSYQKIQFFSNKTQNRPQTFRTSASKPSFDTPNSRRKPSSHNIAGLSSACSCRSVSWSRGFGGPEFGKWPMHQVVLSSGNQKEGGCSSRYRKYQHINWHRYFHIVYRCYIPTIPNKIWGISNGETNPELMLLEFPSQLLRNENPGVRTQSANDAVGQIMVICCFCPFLNWN